MFLYINNIFISLNILNSNVISFRKEIFNIGWLRTRIKGPVSHPPPQKKKKRKKETHTNVYVYVHIKLHSINAILIIFFQYGKYCYCGTDIKNSPKRMPDEECSTPCRGNEQEFCGGDWRISIFLSA